LEHLVIDGQHGFERRAAFGYRNQGAAPRTGKLNVAGRERLQAGSVLHVNDLQVDTFLLHVAAILRDG
jgi:hypothetical protein